MTTPDLPPVGATVIAVEVWARQYAERLAALATPGEDA